MEKASMHVQIVHHGTIFQCNVCDQLPNKIVQFKHQQQRQSLDDVIWSFLVGVGQRCRLHTVDSTGYGNRGLLLLLHSLIILTLPPIPMYSLNRLQSHSRDSRLRNMNMKRSDDNHVEIGCGLH